MSDSEIALLGLLAEKPRYGYELDKIIERRGMRAWTDIAFSSIYAVLRTLETKGLVAATTEVAGNRVRKLFAITKEGKKALKEALIALIAEPEPPKDTMMLVLAYITAVPADDADRAFAARLDLLKETKARLIAKLNENEKSPANVRMMFERSLAAIEAEIEFAKKMAGEGLAEVASAAAQPRNDGTTRPEAEVEAVIDEIVAPPAETAPHNDVKRADDEAKETLF